MSFVLGNVFNENAYILFYKRRNCLLNERWWKPHIERALYEHDEFNAYAANLDAIERQQQAHQHKQQQLQQHANSSSSAQQQQFNQQNLANSRRMTSFKSFKDRFLGSSNSNNPSSSGGDLIDIAGGSEFPAYNPYRPMPVVYNNGDIYDSGVVNHYDEYNKPQR